MRNPGTIMAEIDALAPPQPKWGDGGHVGTRMKAIAESLANIKAWRAANPDKSRRYEALMCELHEAEQAARELARVELVAGRVRAAGVGERTREAAQDPTDTPALLAARDWLRTGKTWLVLAGDVGTGKTVAAVWALLERAAEGRTIAFRRAAHVARLSGFDAGAEELALLKRVGLLVLDDLGTECSTGWGQSILHELLDTRHEEKRGTIITSNLKRADARARLGDRLSDRVQSDGRVVWLEGTSQRRLA